jgi:hypothetical protein
MFVRSGAVVAAILTPARARLVGAASPSASRAAAAARTPGAGTWSRCSTRGLANLRFLVAGCWATVSISLAAIAAERRARALFANAAARAHPRVARGQPYLASRRCGQPLLVPLLWVIAACCGAGTSATCSARACDAALSDAAFEAGNLPRRHQSVGTPDRGGVEPGLSRWVSMRLIIPPQAVAHPAGARQPVRLRAQDVAAISVIGYCGPRAAGTS